MNINREPGEERVSLNLNGRLFFPREERETTCLIKELSSAGVSVECGIPADAGASVVLYAGALGRFEGKTLNAGTRLEIEFVSTAAKRERIAEQVAALRENGLKATLLRRHARSNRNGRISFTRAGGQVVSGEIVDISLGGVSLKTTIRPDLGECVLIAQTAGRVCRYHDSGIGIEFLGRATLAGSLPAD